MPSGGKLDVNALFLGPKSENYRFFKEMLGFPMDDHAEWRKDFHPDDEPAVSAAEQDDPAFHETLLRTRQALAELAGDLQVNSMPWFSPRYLGHICMDTLMAANLGYMLTILYNPNNKRAWGHITSGGTVANYEGLWFARNLKSVPRALMEAMPEAVAGMDDWALSNVPMARCPELLEAAKAVDVLGIGQDNLVEIRVRDREPILAVVAVAGTTEEGAVDPVHEVVRLRRECEERGVSFHVHVDAAYGGYGRALFVDESGRFMEFEEVRKALRERGILHRESEWPDREVYEAFGAMSGADSITVDPRKMGYVPYAAGAVLLRDRRALDLSGYGRIIGASIEGADRLYRALAAEGTFESRNTTCDEYWAGFMATLRGKLSECLVP